MNHFSIWFFLHFQRIVLLFYLYSRAHCEIEKWSVRLSGLRSGTVTAGSQGRYHLPCLSFVIFFWKCKCKLGFWREAEAVSPALSEICVTRNKNNHFWWKCCWTCQTIFVKIAAPHAKSVLKSVFNVMNRKRWRDLPLLWFLWHHVTVTTFLLKTIAAERKSIKTVSKGRYIGYLLDCGPFYISVIVILQKIVVTKKYVTISWYL